MSPHTADLTKRDRDTLDQDKLNNAYALWAPVYDVVFGAVFDPGRKASIEAAEKIGGRILDVGIGTGISLLDFSRGNSIVGVDIPSRCCARRSAGSKRRA